MITGTTMGEISNASTSAWPGKRARQMPSAASVPSTVAASVAELPTMRLFHTDGNQKVEVKKSWYQRKLNPGRG